MKKKIKCRYDAVKIPDGDSKADHDFLVDELGQKILDVIKPYNYKEQWDALNYILIYIMMANGPSLRPGLIISDDCDPKQLPSADHTE
jgi:hypothetical protein